MGLVSLRFIVTTAVLLFIGNGIKEKLVFFDFYEDPEYNDQSCNLVGADEMGPSEDMQFGKYGLLLMAAGDLQHAFNHGTEHAPNGGVFVYHFNSPVSKFPTKITLDNYPPDRKMVGHGLYLSNATDRLYVINHAGHQDVVEVFSVTYKPSCIIGTTFHCPPVALSLIKIVGSPLLGYFMMNDVAEGLVTDTNKGELYVTRWVNYPIRPSGKAGDTVWVMKDTYSQLSKTRFPGVYRCYWEGSEEANCEEATEHKFVGANGITVSPDRQWVYVVDPPDKELNILRRQPNGSLAHHSVTKLTSACDNIDYGDGGLYLGCLPVMWKVVAKMLEIDPHVPVPGSIVHVNDGQWGKFEVKTLLVHDGKKLSQLSTGLPYGNRFFMGGPFSPGLLVCERNK